MADKPEVKERPVIAWILSVLILFLGIAALISGPMLFLSPDGSFMQMSTDVLKGSPFPDYLIPGIILFLFMGVFPLIVGVGLLKTGWRGLYTLNPFTRRQWAWTGSIAVGVILLIWIITETVLLGYVSFLQPVMGMWGLTILLFTALPGVRKYHAA
jgi:hypothetical protein